MKAGKREGEISRLCSVAEAAEVLASGGVIAFPTETYYGLGVDPFNADAVERLYRLKSREREKPLLVLVESEAMLATIIASVPAPYPALMKRYWPGPLTLVFPAGKAIPATVTAGTGRIGVRISSCSTAARLLEEWKKPVTATSANVSGCRPAVSAAEVAAIFAGKIDCIVDGPKTPGGASSTVIDYVDGNLTVLRQGKVTLS